MSFSPNYISGHLVNQIQKPDLRNDEALHVVGVCSNSHRYHSRYRLARLWVQAMATTKNVHLTVVESAYGDRHHELKDECEKLGVTYVSRRTRSAIWNKENMINIGMNHIMVMHPNAKYLAWIDMDVFFNDPNWAVETCQQLQHFEVVQPWSDCNDMGPKGGVLQLFKSFGYQHQRRVPKQMHPSQKTYQYAHTGFAWACTKKFWMAVGGLVDWCVLGSADHHMAFAMIGEVRNTIHGQMQPSFFRLLEAWQKRAVRITHKEVGFVTGMIEHAFHGPKTKRYYRERWQILVAHKFDPENQITHDENGMIQLLNQQPLEFEIARYNISRDEDSTSEY